MKDLINRNSLLKSLEKFAPEKHDALVEMIIKKEPTVEAVPIPFIWDFMDHIEEEIAQTDDSDPRMPGLCARHNALRALLQAWKEQEGKND